MVQGAGQEELVGFGGEGRAPRTPLVERLRAHPWLFAGLAVAIVATAVTAVALHRAAAPELPVVSATAVAEAGDSLGNRGRNPWAAARDGRPEGPVQLERDVDLTFASFAGRVAVFGAAGPGIEPATTPTFTVEEGAGSQRLEIDTAVDCEQVPLPVPPDAYGVAVRVNDGARSVRGTVGLGPVGREWADEVQAACGSWLARTHLRVATATVAPDAARPRAQVAVTITNDGERDAFVAARQRNEPSITVTTTPRGPLRVPAGGTARVTADVVIDRCDEVASIQTTGSGTGVPLPVTSDVVDLYAAVGPVDGLSGSAPTWTTGLGPTSILLSPAAAESMSTGLRAACGGVQGFIAFVAPQGTSYDPGTRELKVRLFVNAPPGKVRDLRLVTVGSDLGPGSFSALTRRTGRLVPDYTGQVATELRYRAPTLRACSPFDTFLPGFDIVARVPAGDGLRTVRFNQYGVQWDDKFVRDELCG